MAEPSPADKAFAADARATYTALVDEGFTPDQAVTLLCQIIRAEPAAPRANRDAAGRRSARVAELLGAASKPSTARGPVADRAADLWNPPAIDPGAPARE